MALSIACALAPTAARAQVADTRGTVLIVRVPHDAAVVARIRAELDANEFRVREVGPDADSARQPLPQLATEARARAALRMQPQRRAIELWVGSDAGAGSAAGSGEVVSTDGGRDDALLALRATEALRARGLRLSRPAAPPPARAAEGASAAAAAAPDRPRDDSSPSVAVTTGVTAAAAASGEPTPEAKLPSAASPARPAAPEPARAVPPAAIVAAASPARPKPSAASARPAPAPANEPEDSQRSEAQAPDDDAASADDEVQPEAPPAAADAGASEAAALLSVELGPALSYSPAGVEPLYAAWLNLRMRPSDRWSVAAFGLVPFAGGAVEDEAQRAILRNYIAGGALELHWPLSVFEVSAGAGAAIVLTHWYSELVLPPNMGKENLEVTGSVLARAGASFALSDDVRVGARVTVGLSVPEINVEFAGQNVARWGRPYFVFALGVEIGLPGFVRP